MSRDKSPRFVFIRDGWERRNGAPQQIIPRATRPIDSREIARLVSPRLCFFHVDPFAAILPTIRTKSPSVRARNAHRNVAGEATAADSRSSKNGLQVCRGNEGAN